MNPAVKQLFERVENPVLVCAALEALKLREPLKVEDLPSELLEPIFILSAAAREMAGAPIVDDPAGLRLRLDEDSGIRLHNLTIALLDGATFNSTPPKFPPSASMNCEQGEVQLRYLPDGARFRCGERYGQLIYRTPSRAVIEISGGKQNKTFQNHKTGEEVTITSSGRERTGCALESPVTPIFSSVLPEDKVWAINAWKEIAGAFDDAPAQKKGKRK